MRHLQYVEPQLNQCRMVLVENDGTEIVSYLAPRSVHHVEHDGRRFRLNGQDRATGELIYVAEVDLV